MQLITIEIDMPLINISEVYSYIAIPEEEYDSIMVDINIRRAIKDMGLSARQTETCLINIENNHACLGDDFENIMGVCVKVDDTSKPITDYEVVNGVIQSPVYPIVQQTVNNQISAIYPLLPAYFPMNHKEGSKLWRWVNPRRIPFSKLCTECPTNIETPFVYDLTLDGCLYFPFIDCGFACITFNKIPSTDEILIDDNETLKQAIAAFVMRQYWEVQMNLKRDQFSVNAHKEYQGKYRAFKRQYNGAFYLGTAKIDVVRNTENPIRHMLELSEKYKNLTIDWRR